MMFNQQKSPQQDPDQDLTQITPQKLNIERVESVPSYGPIYNTQFAGGHFIPVQAMDGQPGLFTYPSADANGNPINPHY